MKLIKLFALCLLTIYSSVAAAQTAETDTLLRILREELAADFEELQQQDVQPYFISFRVQERWDADIAASFGFLGTSNQDHTRTFTPQVRVGSPELDNFKFNNQSRSGLQPLPLTDASTDALRVAIWTQMLTAYDRATSTYRDAQSRLRSQADNEDKAPCFSVLGGSSSVKRPSGPSVPAETFYEPPLSHPSLTPAEQSAWEERLCRISAVFRQWPQFSEAIVRLKMENQRTHLVSTEGTAIVQNRVSYRVFMQASMKTDDGMVLPLTQTYYATSLDALPAEDVMLRDAEDVGRRLEALSKAPVADPFTGPAIMSGQASGVFFHEIFGHRLEGHRMKTGGQTFRKMVGERVLPTDFQVYCDPTLTHYGAQPLNGGYRYDDEGTPARRVNNVVDGILKEFLMSRVPLDSFPESNGHGRTAEGADPVSRQSNLVVETRKPYTAAQLRHLLRDEARRQGKEYGYLFQSVSGGYTQTGEGNSINSFNVTPLEVYRIYVDGRPDELVRGVDLIGTPLSMFSNIAAAGDTPSTFIGVCGAESGWVPVSATSPMIYVSKIETQRRQQKGNLMPILKAPSLDAPREATSAEAIFAALSTELQRAMDSLRIEGQPAPFIIDYRFQRSRRFNLAASFGEITSCLASPWLQKFDAEVILGDYQHSSLRVPEDGLRGSSIPMAADYDNLRRQAWLATDARYKQAIATLEGKRQQMKKVQLPADEAALHDLIPAQPATSIDLQPREFSDTLADDLAAYLRRLSGIAKEFPALILCNADMSQEQSYIYRLTSEGVRVAQLQDDVTSLGFRFAFARGIAPHTQSRDYTSPSELLADSARFTKAAREYVALQYQLFCDSIVQEDYYVGPVLFESGACQTIYNLANGEHNNFRAWHPFLQSNRTFYSKRDRKIADEKITIRQDPSLTTWDGHALVGAYTADANGQAPQAVTLVDRGIYRAQLCGATPALGTSKPTGNLRFNNPNSWGGALAASTVPGVIRVESSKTIPLKKMRKQLLRDAQHEGYDHAYILRKDALYRVNVKDGTETPLRNPGINTSLNMIRHISALSTEQTDVIEREDGGGARFSIVGPKAMILNDVEVPTTTPRQPAKVSLTFPLNR
ncbi:MAG: hypothetical protein IJ209_01540 [Bacteroidaceae bacterium]|nr:hypothetical protein [Bacteroidaceae bacterium]